MKTKLRRFVSILSAMVLMVCCAVPAFADDIGSSYTTWNDTIKQNVFSCIPESDKTDYYTVIAAPNGSGFTYTIIFCKSSTSVTYFGSNLHCYVSKADYNAFACVLVTSENKPLYDDTATGWRSENGDYFDHEPYDYSGGQAKVIYSNVPVLNWEDKKTPAWKDPNAPPVPFTVDYSPSLKTGLVRKGTLVAPGAINDGQEVETNTIAVTVKLTDAFLNASKPISGAYTYSYQFTCFVVPSEYKDSDIKTMSEHAIYTAAQDDLHYLYYENETLDVDDSLSSQPSTGEIAPVSEQWANATGISNCFLLERDSNNTPLRNVTIDLHNIDFEKHKSDSYNIVVLGHIVRISEYGWTAYPSFFKSDCSSLALESTKEYPMNFGSTEQPVINKNFYDYYSVISEDWSFKDYPKFEPHKVGGVTVGDSPLDFKRTAKGVQDYNMWEQGGTDNTLKPDDFDKYKEQKKLDENFGSVDFGLDSIKSVFDGSSDFFKFLTASIGILPTTFLTILISFFVVMLAICVVKWVLK